METPASDGTALVLGATLTYLAAAPVERPEATGALLVAVQRARATLPSLTADSRVRIGSLVRDLHDALFDPSLRPDESVQAALEPAHVLTDALDQLEAPGARVSREARLAALIQPPDRHADDAKSLEARMNITIVLAGVCTLGLAGLGIWVTVSPPLSWAGPAIAAVSLGVAAVALGWNSRRLEGLVRRSRSFGSSFRRRGRIWLRGCRGRVGMPGWRS